MGGVAVAGAVAPRAFGKTTVVGETNPKACSDWSEDSFEYLEMSGEVPAAVPSGGGATHGGGYGGAMKQLPPYDGSRRKDAYKNWKA